MEKGKVAPASLPQTTVVVPVRNGRTELPALFAALASQVTATNAEVVVVDDASTDETLAWLRAQPHPWLRVVALPAWGGENAARNAGAYVARGRTLVFTDADCRPEPGWLAAGCAALDAADWVSGPVRLVASHLGLAERLDRTRFLRAADYFAHGWALTANLFMHRSLFDALGGLDERLVTGGDHDFGMRALAFGATRAWCEQARVEHPLRTSVRAVLRKSFFVGRAYGQELRVHRLREAGGAARLTDRLGLAMAAVQSEPLRYTPGLLVGHAASTLLSGIGCLSGLMEGPLPRPPPVQSATRLPRAAKPGP